MNAQTANPFRSIYNLLIDAGQFHYSDEDLKRLPLSTRRLRLFLTSFCVLFFELACIRWAPAYVRFLSFFLNFVLMASFLGIGVGILAGRRPKLWLPPFPLALFVLVTVVALSKVEISVPSTQVLYYGAGEISARAEHYFMLPVIFLLIVVAFTPLSRVLGRYLASMPPLQAYAWDIVGSLAGIAAFFLMSYFSLPPVIWFSLLSVALLFLLDKKGRFIGAPFLIGALVIIFWVGRNDYWSPYYRIQVGPNTFGGYSINVNNISHQDVVPAQNRETFYYRVYDLFADRPFERVLVIGAGSGSDVSIALKNGAQQVDAVEIDPTIQRLGVQLHPDQPYADSRVHVFINDGRAYMRNTDQTYDLVIFALPDSLTLTSAFSSLRLESFLLTKEAILAAKARLNDDGLLVLYNYYREDWLVQKLAGMVDDAFGAPPFVTTYGESGRAAVIIAGPRLSQLSPDLLQPYVEPAPAAVAGRGLPLPIIGQGLMPANPNLDMSIDDWPFAYMPHRTLPTPYLAALAMVLVIALLAVLLAAPRKTLARFNGHFFWLGVAFMLLETRSLVTFSLLFGSTWMVNSLVFFAILCSVLLAILFNSRVKLRQVNWLYGLLFAALAVNYLIPQQSLLGITSPVLRYSLASLLAFLPIFLANVVFSHAFQETELADIAFGSNLIGSMVGGLCEYMALITGYQSLLLLALVLYALALWRRPKEVLKSETVHG